MNEDQKHCPTYDNIGFQHDEGRPPPYAPPHGIYPALHQDVPNYAGLPPKTINTHQTVTPVISQSPEEKKRGRTCPWKCALCVSLCIILLLAAIGLLLWYFLYFQGLIGNCCRTGNKCLTNDQWCDGVTNCPDGEDEAHCFRFYGTNNMLQSYSPHSKSWLPVCVDNWDDNYGKAVCEQMGYERAEYLSFGKINAGSLDVSGYLRLKPDSYHGSSIQSQLTHSLNCSNSAVSLRCIDCGQSSAGPRSRIVGGTEAANEAWPWQVSLQISDQHICGGSIITRDWILSAAHCFQKLSAAEIWMVKSGDVSLFKMSFDPGRRVQKIISHEMFNEVTNDNDIALLKLQEPLRFSSTVKPVCLPNSAMAVFDDHPAWITGWGALRSSGLSPDVLNQAQVTIYKRDICNRREILDGRVTEVMICAGRLQGGVDSCQGDSGGPLVVKKEGVWSLLGATSWGVGCALRNKPGVYTNIPHFTEWIYEQMQKDVKDN